MKGSSPGVDKHISVRCEKSIPGSDFLPLQICPEGMSIAEKTVFSNGLTEALVTIA